MFLRCPFCGEREISEFNCLGEALPDRPQPGVEDVLARFHDYYYSRANLDGVIREHWYHAGGCLSWLEVKRDTRTHAVLSVSMAADVSK